MSGKIDWSKAPEGTTHYCTACDPENVRAFPWHKKENGVWFFYGTKGWNSYSLTKFPRDFDALIERPTESPAWNGEGLPPVGTVCEWKLKQEFGYVAAEVLFVSGKSIVLRRADGFEWQEALARCCFRPIRTPEQIAAEEREKAIQQMIEDTDYNGKLVRGLFAKLHDAGYRKVEQP